MDELIAQELAKPFIKEDDKITFRKLPQGGMMIVLSDGRKLWFNSIEVLNAKRKIGEVK
jgi:hypothetical protein